LAHADRIVQVPDVRWRSNSDAHAHANTYTNSNSNSDTYAYTDSNSDACTGAERAHEFGCESGLHNAGQLVVDG
jgi:hypothetical protein